MGDVVRFPVGQSPALSSALTTLLCTVLGAVQVTGDTVTAGVAEPEAAQLVLAAVDVLNADRGVGFEQARWQAAVSREATGA